MKFRAFGKTQWQISAVSMGCWNIGGQWGEVAEDVAIDTIHAAFDMGVNLFDTADSYGMGRSESLVGKALKDRRDKVHIATKVGNWGRKLNAPLSFASVYHVVNCCHASLHRLQTDYIDFYQCHIPSPDNTEIFLEAFDMLEKEGKIRAWGISTNDVAAVRAFNRDGRCSGCQINYSILNRTPEKDILPYCQQNNIGVLLRGPIGQGLLAGKFTAETRFDDSVREAWNDGKAREKFLKNLAKVEQLRFLEKPGRALVQAALQFTLAHPAVTCPIPGMKNPDQARSNAAAADGELTAEELARIDQAFPPGTAV
ncbi:MAG: General stress protein 69 [candidate division BRC1 bacterium ADurb.BinA364]|nr:MAG: General stress protein 69 [candidate division BRC1 bacterium ADurb.BinA364]